MAVGDYSIPTTPEVKLAAIVQGAKVPKPSAIEGTSTVTDLRVSEILNAFVTALSRLDLVTERINKFCDNADSELDV